MPRVFVKFAIKVFLVVSVCTFLAGPSLGKGYRLGHDKAAAKGVGRFADKTVRQQAVNSLARKYRQEKQAADALARSKGWKTKGSSGGKDFELVSLRDGRFYVHTTFNTAAAESTGANLVRGLSPYYPDGSGFTVGVWDSGHIDYSHVEFGSRVTEYSTAEGISLSLNDHSTHVGGTIGAAGISASAKGMAPAVGLDSWDFDSDIPEMTGEAASSPGEAGKIYISNHSYGHTAGWYRQVSPKRWYGEWSNPTPEMESENFGIYESYCVDWDELCWDAPYYLPFKAAGNDRGEAPPAAGESFERQLFNSWIPESYDSAIHPGKDGGSSGFDTISLVGNAKNIITIGSVKDAIRDADGNFVSGAAMVSYSGWGPTDDGRVKPDIVANGFTLRSTTLSNTYGYKSGTSMATPNASGSAVLLMEHYQGLFGSGEYMRASTLKGLIIHTADDLGRAGPDYEFGWGLMNVKAGVHMLDRHYHAWPCTRIVEGFFDKNDGTDSWDIIIDDTSEAVKFTICWTDKKGTAKSSLDDRTSVLVNDLDLRVTGPTGTVYFPFSLDVLNPSAVATATSGNDIDNVEQVVVPAGMIPGSYTVQVTHKGSFFPNNSQWYSLISGSGLLSPTPPLDGDCVIRYTDFVMLADNWQRTDCGSGNAYCSGCDTDKDSGVGISDLALFADHWLWD